MNILQPGAWTKCNGGKGGDIVFEAVPNPNTLIDFRYTHRAVLGGNGLLIAPACWSTRRGDQSPLGMQIFAEDWETLLAGHG